MNLNTRHPIVLSDEFSEILNALENSSHHFFITGRAGTGKSTLLTLFKNTTKKCLAILAPTGVAALNVRGQTIHSFFGFPPRMINKSEITPRKNSYLYKKVECIIIDEVSMVRADMMDNIDYFLRINRGKDEPFGGVQMILFGDLYQLPPVISSPFEKQYFREHYQSAYFFSSFVFEACPFELYELQQVHRQEERRFIKLLDNIRQSAMDEDDLEELNTRHLPLPEDKKYFVYLCARNATAEQINSQELLNLGQEKFVFNAEVTGDFNPQFFPTENILVIKRGAQVMFVKNDPQKQYVNGSIGTVNSIVAGEIYVDLLNEQGEEIQIKLEKQAWENIKYSTDDTLSKDIKAEVTGTFKQYPIKLAWAITIHKSQGKTFEKIIVDMGGGAFESGQTYVALSRCKKLEGIFLKKPLTPKDVFVDPIIVDFYDNIRRR